MNNTIDQNSTQPKSMTTFLVIWVGQFISMVGSGLTGFGLSVWVYTETGKATPMALTALAFNLPRILLSPIAGSVADRFNRKRIMLLADTAAVLITVGFGALIFTDSLQIWHIYAGSALSSIFGAFQEPAYRSSITMIVPKKHLARAAGIQQIGSAMQSILVPVLAGILYGLVGFRGIILIDFFTYFFAIGALIWAHIPQPKIITDTGDSEKSSLLKDALFGWKYLRERPGLVTLLFYFAVINFFLSFSGVLVAPLVLSFGTPTDMGIVQMAGGAAMLVGGLLMGIWGGPKDKRIWGVILTIFLSGFGFFIVALKPQVWSIALGMFSFLFFIPIAAALSQAVWQVKIPPHIQGRVFAMRAMLATSIVPLANLLAGPLADNIFEPMMSESGALASTFLGGFIGTGQGRGIAVIFLISAVFMWLSSIVIFTYPRVRNLEEEIPDAIPDDMEPETIEGVEEEGSFESIPAPAAD
jgi:MFS family permease